MANVLVVGFVLIESMTKAGGLSTIKK